MIFLQTENSLIKPTGKAILLANDNPQLLEITILIINIMLRLSPSIYFKGRVVFEQSF